MKHVGRLMIISNWKIRKKIKLILKIEKEILCCSYNLINDNEDI